MYLQTIVNILFSSLILSGCSGQLTNPERMNKYCVSESINSLDPFPDPDVYSTSKPSDAHSISPVSDCFIGIDEDGNRASHR